MLLIYPCLEVRTSLLEDTANFLLGKSLAAGVDCDYGKSVLHLLYLLLSPDVRRLKVGAEV